MSYTEGKLERGPICDWELWIGADHHIADVHGNLPIRHANTDELIRRWNAFEEGGSHKALVGIVKDMLSGLKYLRETDRLPYGLGIDRLEETGRAALAKVQSSKQSVAPER